MLHKTAPTNAQIGPNALIQTVTALRAIYDDDQTAAILARSGQLSLMDEHPADMVPECEFDRLVQAMADALGEDCARRVLHRSGALTADYLLAHRIPGLFQRLLRFLSHPWGSQGLAMRLLLLAVSKNAWTFVGSGAFSYGFGDRAVIRVVSSIHPVGAASGFYGGTFERLVHSLIDAEACVYFVYAAPDNPNLCEYIVEYS
jgi:divinyl protochlorophyllide a 8-vinyl-reductase